MTGRDICNGASNQLKGGCASNLWLIAVLSWIVYSAFSCGSHASLFYRCGWKNGCTSKGHQVSNYTLLLEDKGTCHLTLPLKGSVEWAEVTKGHWPKETAAHLHYNNI